MLSSGIADYMKIYLECKNASSAEKSDTVFDALEIGDTLAKKSDHIIATGKKKLDAHNKNKSAEHSVPAKKTEANILEEKVPGLK